MIYHEHIPILQPPLPPFPTLLPLTLFPSYTPQTHQKTNTSHIILLYRSRRDSQPAIPASACRRPGSHGLYPLFVPQVTHCNTAKHTATHCSTLQRTAMHCNALQRAATSILSQATYYDTQQHTTTHRITPQHHTSTLQQAAPSNPILGNALQHTTAHCSTLQHFANSISLPGIFTASFPEAET